MNKEEYLEAIQNLNIEFKNKRRELDVQFALSSNIIEVGDIVSDNNCTIRVENIKLYPYTYDIPTLCFEGARLTKKLEPFKSGEKAVVYNVKKHIPKCKL